MPVVCLKNASQLVCVCLCVYVREAAFAPQYKYSCARVSVTQRPKSSWWTDAQSAPPCWLLEVSLSGTSLPSSEITWNNKEERPLRLQSAGDLTARKRGDVCRTWFCFYWEWMFRLSSGVQITSLFENRTNNQKISLQFSSDQRFFSVLHPSTE